MKAALALLAVLAAVNLASAVRKDEVTLTMVNAGTTGQFRLSMSTANANNMTFERVTCQSEVLNDCPQQRVLKDDQNDFIRVNFTLFNAKGPNGTLATFRGLTPIRIEARLCYTLTSATDRAWRKKNKAYPRLSQNCPRLVGKRDWNAASTGNATQLGLDNSGSFTKDFNTFDEIPDATWFASLWVYCNGPTEEQLCAYVSTEKSTNTSAPNPNQAYMQTQVVMGVTTGMKIACGIMSAVGPLFFVIFFIADNLHYKKTGKPIHWF
eukprot:CAMPEP_0202859736 /NCGR_PEP_ID=MMETSP1391-20130828/1725_1 /ASSEMBLY_ACC=CAM_ASM_000867 /TAXON_ID=1034604 /ORGANISM="Chlamydomonas leiostraca, Strain SAG 11-49" /LENGTH=265 /DNA_ID=CAMNT_0049538805 /DNA_START=1 /DNA_END=798 /DNA_ORIENTATION=-